MPRRRRVVWLDERGAPSGDGYRDSARFPADGGPTGQGVRAWTPCRHVCGLPARRESARASTADFGGASTGGVGGPLGGVEPRRGCSLAREPPGLRVALPMVRLEGIRAGDIVEVDRLGRRFHALVGGCAEGGLSIEPLDRGVTYRTCRPHEVLACWTKRGRPRQTGEPLERAPLQLALETPVGDQPHPPERRGR